MGMINGCDDLTMLIYGLSREAAKSVTAGRECALIKVARSVYEDKALKNGSRFAVDAVTGVLLDGYTLRVDGEDAEGAVTFLHLAANALPVMRRTPQAGVTVTRPDEDALASMLSGKDLAFYAYYGEGGGAEGVLNAKLQDLVFGLRNDGEYYLCDEFTDVKIFLQKVSDEKAPDFSHPFDVRELDICKKMLAKLKKAANAFYGDALIFDYAAVSEKIKARYFLAKFHSNRLWDADPVCILNYRISAFVLPKNVPKDEAKGLPRDRMTKSFADGSEYVVDSICVNSDICDGLSDFGELLDSAVLNISLA